MSHASTSGGEPRAVHHAKAIIAATSATGIRAKTIGGVGCWLHNVEHSEEAHAFMRDYHDVDFVMSRKAAVRGGQVLEELGYTPVSSFNSVQGETRLMYLSTADQIRIDVFIGSFEMCHTIPMEKPAFTPDAHPALNLVELLLTKLQVVNCNEKDLHDLASLFAFHAVGSGPDDIDGERFARLLGKDWGLWRTATTNLEKVEAQAGRAPSHGSRITDGVRALRALAEQAPKSPRWKARAVLGERVRWYEQPEEPEVEMEVQVR